MQKLAETERGRIPRRERVDPGRPHVVMVIARGEAIRTFLYSSTLAVLSRHARVTLLSVIHDAEMENRFGHLVERIIPLQPYEERKTVTYFRHVLHAAHYRWIWTEVVKCIWERYRARAQTAYDRFKLGVTHGLARILAYRPVLEALTEVERFLSLRCRPTGYFDKLFAELKPDLVFNCSHIHAPLADLPLRVAKHMGIPTAVFIFSWDNLTSRGRIFVPYDYYFVWNQVMHAKFLDLYPRIHPDRVFTTGTPQFDFHFHDEFCLSREELCRRVGLDPARPFILYTTGADWDFRDEHKFVELVMEYLQTIDVEPKPQMVVRTYIKGTSREMMALADRKMPGIIFPPILWKEAWVMPMHEDLYIYTSLLKHCSMGINAASTVSLELMMLDKPTINLAMEPPGSDLPHYARFSRHVGYDHYRPVAESGGVMVARSVDDLRRMIKRGLTDPQEGRDKRKAFIYEMFGDTADGASGRRVAELLVRLARAR